MGVWYSMTVRPSSDAAASARLTMSTGICQHRFPSHQLWVRAHHWLTVALALHVPGSRQHHGALGFHNPLLHAAGPH
jgi:hypothetical protein